MIPVHVEIQVQLQVQVGAPILVQIQVQIQIRVGTVTGPKSTASHLASIRLATIRSVQCFGFQRTFDLGPDPVPSITHELGTGIGPK